MKILANLIGSAIVILLIAACGGGGGGEVAGIGGTGKIASGTITGFGSIFVNGIEYDIDTASCEVDGIDETGNCQASLHLGMVVTVTATVDGLIGTASSVLFDDDVEGPVSNLTTDADGLRKQFTVLGIQVVADRTGTTFDDSTAGFGFDTIANNDVVEVSGYFDAAGTLRASYMEKKGTLVPGVTQVELKGIVSAAPASGAGINDTFIVNTVTVNIVAGADLSDLPGGLVSNGSLVEVKGVFTNTASIDASKIELETTEIGDDGDQISLQGLVSDFSGDLASFTVAGQSVNASSARLEPAGLQLSNDMTVEVEGILVGGILIADELEARNDDIRIEATVSSLTASSVTLQVGNGSIEVNIDNQTELEDETDVIENMQITDISSGDFLEIRGFVDGSAVVASEIKRTRMDDVILQGQVENTVSGNSITILGIVFFVDAGTQYEDINDTSISSSSFFATDRVGSIVKIKDDQPGDGTADEVDLEN